MGIVPWQCAQGDSPSVVLPCASEVDLAPLDDSVDTNKVVITGSGTITSFGNCPRDLSGDADLNENFGNPVAVTKKVVFEPTASMHIILTNGTNLLLLGNVNRTIATKSIGVYSCDVNGVWTEESFTDTTSAGGGGGGTPGPPGPTGPQGPAGATGPAGPQGPQGTTGATGSQGPQGVPGTPGATGPQGPQGTTGATGSTGPAGPTGSTGAAGPGYAATSTTSLAIATGSQTFTTQSGLAYSSRSRARAGSAGTAGAFMEGSVTSYSGTSLVIFVDTIGGSGTHADWNINLAGIPGAPGATGAQGPQGTTGATGAQGPQGPQGPQGNTGATGSQGPQGLTGNTGATGPAGPTGATGPAGPAVAANITLEVSLAANQTGLAVNAYSTCKYDTKITDVQNAYNPATGLFTPTVAGVYSVSATVGTTFGSGQLAGISLCKNGSRTGAESQTSQIVNGAAGVNYPLSVSGLIYCNGTTDTISVQAWSQGTFFTGANLTIPAMVNMIAVLQQTGPQGVQGPAGPQGLPGNVPVPANIALEVSLNANQTTGVVANTWGTALYDTKITDVQNAYSTSTGLFKPTVAGVYAVTASLGLWLGTNTWVGLAIVKNGLVTNAESQVSKLGSGATGAYGSAVVSALIYCNGTTDTISVQGYVNDTSFHAGSGLPVPSATNMIAVLQQTGPQGATGAQGPQGLPGNVPVPANIELEVNLAANQTGVTAAAWNTCKYDTKVTDAQNAYSISTGLFTPIKAGVYAITASVGLTQGAGQQIGIAIVKNGAIAGAEAQATKWNNGGTANNNTLSIAALIFCNGTTDTISVQAWSPAATSFLSTANAGATVNMIAVLQQTGPQGVQGIQGAGFAASSTTSLTIGTGSQTFATQSGLAYSVGARVRLTSASGVTNWMEGVVTAYSGTSMTVNVDTANGSGTKTDWNINIAGQPSAVSGLPHLPTRTVLLSGSGTYTTPVNCTWIDVEMVGGGQGGARGGGTPGVGGAGTATTFGPLTAPPGINAGPGVPTTGDINIQGGAGGTNGNLADGSTFSAGSSGGNSFYGGAGNGIYNAIGQSAAPNTGSGGAGGGTNVATLAASGAGGNAAGYLKKLIASPASTYAYSVGTGGNGVASAGNGFGGGAGGSGMIVVTEHYGA
jgi:collagen type I/II/III/V/XI/XXIV/XXVII alpha